MSETTKPANHQQLVVEYGALTELKAEADERLAEIRRILVLELPIGTHEIADRKVIVSIRNDLDKAALAAAYPADDRPELYAVALDPKEVRRHLPKVEVDRFCKPSPPMVTVR